METEGIQHIHIRLRSCNISLSFLYPIFIFFLYPIYSVCLIYSLYSS